MSVLISCGEKDKKEDEESLVLTGSCTSAFSLPSTSQTVFKTCQDYSDVEEVDSKGKCINSDDETIVVTSTWSDEACVSEGATASCSLSPNASDVFIYDSSANNILKNGIGTKKFCDDGTFKEIVASTYKTGSFEEKASDLTTSCVGFSNFDAFDFAKTKVTYDAKAGTWTEDGQCDDSDAIASCTEQTTESGGVTNSYYNTNEGPNAQTCQEVGGTFTEFPEKKTKQASYSRTDDGVKIYCYNHREMNDTMYKIAKANINDSSLEHVKATWNDGLCSETGAKFTCIGEKDTFSTKDSIHFLDPGEATFKPSCENKGGTWTAY
jgi:hypothetical protein